MHAAAANTDARLPVIPALALLEDHLNAVLRHGETLRALERPVAIEAFSGPGVPAMIRRNRQIDVAVREAHALELSIVLRLTQARAAANDAKRHVAQAATLLRLVATAADLVVGELPPAPPSGDFFASRGIASSATAAALGEGYLIGAKTPLSAVMDAAAAALDLIDLLVPGRASTGGAVAAR